MTTEKDKEKTRKKGVEKCEVCGKKAEVQLVGSWLFGRQKRRLCRKHFIEWAKEHPMFIRIGVEPYP